MITTKRKLKRITYQEFADRLENTYFFDSLIDEMYWSDSFSAGRFVSALEAEAERQGAQLIGIGQFDYEDYFWQLYAASEKGLS